MPKIRVLVIDPHPAVGIALAVRLRSDPALEVLAVAPDWQYGLELAQAQRADVILLEPKGAISPEVDLARELERTFGSGSAPALIWLTSYAMASELDRAQQAGARRYLLKNLDSRQLIQDIKAVATERNQHEYPQHSHE